MRWLLGERRCEGYAEQRKGRRNQSPHESVPDDFGTSLARNAVRGQWAAINSASVSHLHARLGLNFQVRATRLAVIRPLMRPAIGIVSASAALAAQPIEEKASAKVASRDEVWRRRNWLRLACTRNQSWIAVAQAALSMMAPAVIAQGEEPLVVVATNEGRMLVFPLAELPELARGKGNKLIGIPSARAAAREEFVAGLCVVTEGDTLQVTSGGHYRNFKWSELEHFRGERGRRGSKLPKGYQRVTRLQVVAD